MLQAIFILILIIVLIAYLYFLTVKKYNLLLLKNQELVSSKQSLSTKYGQITEQFIPFMASFPYDEKKFRFIGNPIDGIQFEEDEVIFLEFKSANSTLSSRQKRIKEIIGQKRVRFEEMNLK